MKAAFAQYRIRNRPGVVGARNKAHDRGLPIYFLSHSAFPDTLSFDLNGAHPKSAKDNNHWLSRMESSFRSWHFRSKVKQFVTGTDPAIQVFQKVHRQREE